MTLSAKQKKGIDKLFIVCIIILLLYLWKGEIGD